MDKYLEELCTKLSPEEAYSLRIERAAILEYQAGCTRKQAEQLAGL